MIKKDELDELIWLILHGWPRGFESCQLIQRASESTDSSEKDDILGITAIEACVVRTEIIVRIIQEIKSGEHLLDHLSRLFHALTLLKVDKNDSRLPSSSVSYIYNAARALWMLDDGEKAYSYINLAAWYVAEMMKG